MSSRPSEASPFHAGEQELQRQAGVRERLEEIGHVVLRSYMPEPHRELFGKLPTLLLGATDTHGQPWATLLQGAPGFIRTPDAATLRVDALPGRQDPLWPALTLGASVGVLGLEPHTRRRNRLNGRVHQVDDKGFTLRVDQSFGNCPKYIQARRPMAVQERIEGPRLPESEHLSAAALELINRADTFFIATASGAPAGGVERSAADGVDVSHRGGPPGFVQMFADGHGHRLWVPDYPGNRFFNTLGNLWLWPHAGLLFFDADSGDVLQLACEARLLPADAGPGAATAEGVGPPEGPVPPTASAAVPPTGAVRPERWLQLTVRSGWWRPAALPLRWTAAEPAPQFLGAAPAAG
jgi:uncharacterized protein